MILQLSTPYTNPEHTKIMPHNAHPKRHQNFR